MCERYIDWLPLTCPQPVTWPISQTCALTGNQPFSFQDNAQPTEPHQSGLTPLIFNPLCSHEVLDGEENAGIE